MVKVLEMLKNFFQEVFKQGLGQSPKVLGLGQSPEVLSNIHPKQNDPRVVPHPTHQPCAKPYFQKKFLPPETKTSPKSTRTMQNETNFRSAGRVLLGEVLGE